MSPGTKQLPVISRSRATQHQLPVGKAMMKCYLRRTYMSPGVALVSLSDSWTPLSQDPHASLLSTSAPHQPTLQLLMAPFFHPVAGFVTSAMDQ